MEILPVRNILWSWLGLHLCTFISSHCTFCYWGDIRTGWTSIFKGIYGLNKGKITYETLRMRFLLNQFCLVEWVSLFTQHNWVKSGLHVFVINLELKVLTVFSTYQGCYKNFKFPVYAIFTALFKNTKTMKIKSRLHNCIFRHRQS